MKEEEIIWHEENWSRGKNTIKSMCHSGRTSKITNRLYWQGPWGDYGYDNYNNDKRSWKTNRKNQYHIKKVLPEKKRKPREREHWRDKRNISWLGVGYYKLLRLKQLKRKEYISYSWMIFTVHLEF